MKKIYITIITVIVIISVAYYTTNIKSNDTNTNIENTNNNIYGNDDISVKKKLNKNKNETNINEKNITMYKSPNCGCCDGYADELIKQGFQVETIKIDDMTKIKKKYNIPKSKQSCHTSVVANYFIEGHVPIEALQKLLKEKPMIDGIGLPKMPSGTPGMPGPKYEEYRIYQSVDGEFSEYINI